MKGLLLLAFLASGLAGDSKTKGTPIDKVVTLIKGLASQIEKDGKDEQASYDQYACWVESTLRRKAGDITQAKELIETILLGVYDSYKKFCRKQGLTPPNLNIQVHDGYREGSR